MRLRWTFLLILVGLSSFAHADQFDAIEGKALLAATKGAEAKAVERLTVNDLGALPNLLKETRATLLAVTTTKGNVTRLLVTPELRKPEGGGEPTLVILLERFDTFDIEDLGARIARGREMVLFPGFQVDLDTGQIVPEGRGADLALVEKGGLALVPLKGAKLFTLSKVPAPDPTKPPQPTPGRTVVPRDFAGRYRLYANGQWSGTLDLAVDAMSEVTGTFRSDTQGASYPVTGQVGVDGPNRIKMTVKFPRARASFDGYLWTDGKGALAGTFRIEDRPFGFFAVREGGRIAPEGVEVAAVADASGLTIELKEDRLWFEGKEFTVESLTEALRPKAEGENPPSVTLLAPGDATYETVRKAIAGIEGAGLHQIRLSVLPKSTINKP